MSRTLPRAYVTAAWSKNRFEAESLQMKIRMHISCRRKWKRTSFAEQDF